MIKEAPGLDWDGLCVHLAECGVETVCGYQALARVVVRTEQGDHWIAAAHKDGETLVLDLGVKITP